MHPKSYILLAICLFASLSPSHAQVDARMLQYPDVSGTQIAFSYGGDIWIVPKEGGVAHKITNAPGMETFPRFSPDGSQLAFSGNYNGDVDVYVLPSMGGLAKRITYHDMPDRIVDWYPDGHHLIFASSRESGKQRFDQFYRVSDSGGLAERLPLPYAEFGALSPDGSKIAFTPISRAFRTWKRYRGGMAADIWVFDLSTMNAANITNNDANDEFPMWHDNKIYFLSDRDDNERANIWSYDLDTKAFKEITKFTDYDIHFPSIGGDNIVFEAAGRLYLLDLTTEQYHEVKVSVVTDESTLMAHTEKVAKYLSHATPSHDGNRAIVEARGELFSVPAENGPVIDITQTSGVAERYPSWSPDGKYVAYWSDRSGEYELTLRDLSTGGTEKTVSHYGPGFRYHIFWSPDSKKLAFIDQAMTIHMYELTTNTTTTVDKELWQFEGGLESYQMSWSSDSRFLAFTKDMPNQSTALAVYDVNAKQVHQLTSGFYADKNPVFDPDGKYLYFTTNRDFNAAYSDFDDSWVYDNSTQLAAAALTDEIPSLLAPKNDTTSIKKEDKTAATKNTKTKAKDKKGDTAKDSTTVKEVKITYAGFEERMEILTPKGGNMGDLSAVSGKIIFHRSPSTGSDDDKKPLVYYDLDKREEKTIVDDADGYTLAADGKKLLVLSHGSLYSIDIGENQKLDKKMPLDRMEMVINPRQEWTQIFNDAWRLERDFFYDPNMHGVDWNAMHERYGKLLDQAVTRWDLNYIIGELIAEISSSHTYRGGGDTQTEPSVSAGYLGIDWGLKNGAYYVKRIVHGAAWDAEVRSPLDEPGLKIKEGDYILAVNSVKMDITRDPVAAFEGLANQPVELTVNSQPTMANAWTVLVRPISDETRLRNLEWIESNRKKVDEASQGKIGYIYVPSTGGDGQMELARMFYAQFNKEGLIIDERFNNGGQIPDRFIELLNRKPLAFWAVRDGATWQWPPIASFGPKAMLINGWSGSGGDAFPDYFRKAGLGPLIGTRTWGGLIGYSGAPNLIDGGFLTVPSFRMYNPDGTWFLEGHGVDPDIPVENNPGTLAQGTDQQLQRAIDEVMKEIATHPAPRPEHPPYQKR